LRRFLTASGYNDLQRIRARAAALAKVKIMLPWNGENARLLALQSGTSMEAMFTEVNTLSPHREAAFFYGLFLRGHSIESLRRDIDIAPETLARWETLQERDPLYREAIQVMVPYRKRVLAIFESLITSDNREAIFQ